VQRAGADAARPLRQLVRPGLLRRGLRERLARLPRHFGFRTAAGRYKGTPNFKLAYSDYSARGRAALANWPHDSRLQARHLTDYDTNDSLGANAGFGAFADEALLNKRVGWFLVYLLDYFGSMNLADDANTFPLVPTAIRTGDFLLERWQKNGIGHTLIAKAVTPVPAANSASSWPRDRCRAASPSGRTPAAAATISSPRSPARGNAYDGSPYAKLGGGLRRYRVTQNIGGYWINDVPSWTGNDAIRHDDYATIAARPAQFGQLLADVTPRRKLALIQGLRGRGARGAAAAPGLVHQPDQARGLLRRADAVHGRQLRL